MDANAASKCVKPDSSDLKVPTEQTNNRYVISSNDDQADNYYMASIGYRGNNHYYHNSRDLWHVLGTKQLM